MPDSSFECALAQGIKLFNAREFYEAHEVWEEQWHLEEGDHKKFLQGLIQAAVAFYKLDTGNPRGLHKMLVKSIRNLAPLPLGSMDILLEEFLEKLADWDNRAQGMVESGRIDYKPEDLPRLERIQ